MDNTKRLVAMQHSMFDLLGMLVQLEIISRDYYLDTARHFIFEQDCHVVERFL